MTKPTRSQVQAEIKMLRDRWAQKAEEEEREQRETEKRNSRLGSSGPFRGQVQAGVYLRSVLVRFPGRDLRKL
jgi:hypothetical protein